MKQEIENKIKVGDTLYSYVKGVIKKEKVKKVGRIYFYINSDYNNNYPYSLETLQYNNKEGYSQRNSQLYKTEQEIFDILEKDNLLNDIGNYFKYNQVTLSLEELRMIAMFIKKRLE